MRPILWLLASLSLVSLASAIPLPWSTTYDCDEWAYDQGALDCDNISAWGGWGTCGRYEEITSAANNPNGGGGRGQRHWVDAGENQNTGGLGIYFDNPPSDMWMRWYMKYPSTFQWSHIAGDKVLYMYLEPRSADCEIIPIFSGDDGFQFTPQGMSEAYASMPRTTVGAWSTTMGNSNLQGDGLWHCYEVHVRMDTNGGDGVGEMWIDDRKIIDQHDVNYGGLSRGNTGISSVLIASNQKYPSSSCQPVDYDDIAVSETDRIGCLGAPPVFACNDGADNDGDGLTDYPNDPGCSNANDNDEHGTVECDNGLDDDGDGQIDTADGGCLSLTDNDETDCGDGVCEGGEDSSSCSADCGAPAVCGNSILETGEQCDDGNTVTESCTYGLTSCTVCDAICQNVSGSASYCSDGTCDSQNENSSTCPIDCAPTNQVIFFQESFEDTNFASRGWYDNTGLILSTAEYVSGSTSSAEFQFTAGATTPLSGSAVRHLFPDSETVFIDYWVKYSSNWMLVDDHELYVLTNANGAYDGLAFTYLIAYIQQNQGYPRIHLQDGVNIDQNNLNVNMCPGQPAHSENRAVAGCNGNCDGYTDSCYDGGGGTYNNVKLWQNTGVQFSHNVDPYYNDWHHVQVYLEMNSIVNSIGQVDGVMQYWFDGNLIIDHNDVIFRTSRHTNQEWNQFLIGPYMGNGAPATQTFWIDNLTVSDNPLNSPAPAVPGDLNVDGRVDILDLLSVQDLHDLMMVGRYFGNVY